MEQPTSSDWNQAQSQLDRALRDYLDVALSGRTSLTNERRTTKSGFVADSFKVRPKNPTSMTVEITSGIGFQVVAVNPAVDSAIDSVVGLSDLTEYKPLTLQTSENIVLDASPAAAHERYDIIEIKADRRRENTQAVNIYDSAGKQYLPAAPPIAKTLAWDLNGRQGKVAFNANSTTGIGYKTGQVAVTGAGAIPATTAGYIRIAAIYVFGGVATIEENVIVDDRPLLPGLFRVSAKVIGKTNGAGNPYKPTVTEMVTPPGVRMSFAGLNDQSASMTMTVAGGGQLLAFRPCVTIQSLGSVNINPLVLYASSLPAIFQATLTEQIFTNTGNNGPAAIQIAIGQWIAQATWLATAFSNAAAADGFLPAKFASADVIFSVSADLVSI